MEKKIALFYYKKNESQNKIIFNITNYFKYRIKLFGNIVIVKNINDSDMGIYIDSNKINNDIDILIKNINNIDIITQKFKKNNITYDTINNMKYFDNIKHSSIYLNINENINDEKLFDISQIIIEFFNN